MKILVTGGAGFIGSRIATCLLERGHDVKVLDSLENQVHGKCPKIVLDEKIEFMNGDIRDRKVIERALEGVDMVSHQAAAVGIGQSMYQAYKYTDVNSLATALLMETIVNNDLDVRKVVVASSVCVYGEGTYECGDCGVVYPRIRSNNQLKRKEWEMRCPECRKNVNPVPIKEDKPQNPTNIYSITKQSQEEIVHSMGMAYGIPTVGLRYFVGYGRGQSPSNPYTGVSMIFSTRILNGNPPLIYEDGLQTRDFTHVEDIVQSNILALEKSPMNYESFNVGTGKPTNILNLAKLLIRLYGREGKIEPIVLNSYRSSDVRHAFADISKIRKMGFEPTVNLEQGMSEVAEWLIDRKPEDNTDYADEELRKRGLIK